MSQELFNRLEEDPDYAPEGPSSSGSYSWIDYVFNPYAQLSGIWNGLKNVGSWIGSKFDQLGDFIRGTGSGESGLDQAVSKLYDDLTGKSQTLLQNQLQRELAEEEYQRNLQSIGDTAAAYEAAGFNRNMLYGGSNGNPVSYSAPNLQAYSGSAKLDTILSRAGKVLNLIPALYSSTAALEGIDQAREKTKQQEIKTMSMGMSLLDQGYNVGKKSLSLPFIPVFKRPGRKWEDKTDFFSALPYSNDNSSFYAYQDAALKNQFDLLNSIGIKNRLTDTRNNYLGYQYELDRRFGSAGRIVGIASQGLGSAANLLKSVGSLKKPSNYDRIYYPSGYSQVYH